MLWVVQEAVKVLLRSLPETILWGTTAASLVQWWWPPATVNASTSTTVELVPFLSTQLLSAAMLVYHLCLRGGSEGFLWQVVPLVPVTVAELSITIAGIVNGSGPIVSMKGWLGWTTWFAGWLLCGASLTALLTFPPTPFPTGSRLPRAQYTPQSADSDDRDWLVGFRHGEEEVTNSTDGSSCRRAFYVWYPAASGVPTTASSSSSSSSSSSTMVSSHYFPQYSNHIELLFESMSYRLPGSFLFSHLGHVRPNALVADAPLLPPADGRRWPVIVFSHGLYGFPSLYTYLCSRMASLGYIVMAVGHTDGSGYILSPTSGQILTAFDSQSFDNASPELWAFRNRQVNVRVTDLEATLDLLSIWNKYPSSPFYGTMDLQRVVVVGHSFGGATCLEFVLKEAAARVQSDSSANKDWRVRSAVVLDGWMYPLEGSDGPSFDRTIPPDVFQASAPVLFIKAEKWVGDMSYFRSNIMRMEQLCSLSNGRWHSVIIKGTGHHNWNDFPFYFPILARALGLTREMGLKDAYDYTLTLIDAFLADTVFDNTNQSGWPQFEETVSRIKSKALTNRHF